MKIRNSGGDAEEIKVEMTPMIDIVFQLLVFFIMTFKIVEVEGDFNIKMPLSAPSEGLPQEDDVPPMKISLKANEAGRLASISLNGEQFPSMQKLNEYIITIVGDDRGPGSVRETAEVELDCDYNLHYLHVVEAVTAVSGTVVNDEVVKLIEKIKFAPPQQPG